MPQFGARSQIRLDTLDPILQVILMRAIQVTDFSIICGHRGEAEQNQAFEAGNSQLVYPRSKHNSCPSRAVDIAPYPIDWDDIERFCFLAGVVKTVAWSMGVGIIWGGIWSFKDYPHFELEDSIWLSQ